MNVKQGVSSDALKSCLYQSWVSEPVYNSTTKLQSSNDIPAPPTAKREDLKGNEWVVQVYVV